MILQILNDTQAYLNDQHFSLEKGKPLAIPFLILGIIVAILPFLLLFDIEWKIGFVIVGVCLIIIPEAIIGIGCEIFIDKSKDLIQRKVNLFGLLKIRRGTWQLSDLKQAIARKHDNLYSDVRPTTYGQIFFKFKNGEEKLVLNEGGGPRPVNCLQVLHKFLVGEYLTPGIIKDEIKIPE